MAGGGRRDDLQRQARNGERHIPDHDQHRVDDLHRLDGHERHDVLLRRHSAVDCRRKPFIRGIRNAQHSERPRRRYQPGLWRRRKRQRAAHERFRRAVQPRHADGLAQRLVCPLHLRHWGDVECVQLADRAFRNDRTGAPLPRAGNRWEQLCRLAVRRRPPQSRRHRNDCHGCRRWQGRSGRIIRCAERHLPDRQFYRGLRRLRRDGDQFLLRGERSHSRDEQHDRGASRKRRMHRHE